MFHHILVPLDGSTCAEQALEPAAQIAREYHASIVLLRVVNVLGSIGMPSFSSAAISQQIRMQEETEAHDYLAKMQKLHTFAGLEVSVEVHTGNIAECILEAVDSQSTDLVIMSRRSHAENTWPLGRVAQKVVRHCKVPVLLLHEEYPLALYVEQKRKFITCVGLDGSTIAERSIQPALAITAVCVPPQRRELRLLRIVEAPDQVEADFFHIHYHVNLQDAVCKEVKAYLEEIATQVNQVEKQSLGVNVNWDMRVGRDTANSLVAYGVEKDEIGNDNGYDLLALVTHGRSGLARWSLGSVTERVLNASKRPLLVVHAP